MYMLCMHVVYNFCFYVFHVCINVHTFVFVSPFLSCFVRPSQLIFTLCSMETACESAGQPTVMSKSHDRWYLKTTNATQTLWPLHSPYVSNLWEGNTVSMGLGAWVVFTPVYDMCCPGWSECYDKTISSYVRRIWWLSAITELSASSAGGCHAVFRERMDDHIGRDYVKL